MTPPPATSRAEDGSAGAFRLGRDPAVLVVTVTGLFHLWRGALVDGLIFLSVVVALVASGLGGGRPPDVDRPAPARVQLWGTTLPASFVQRRAAQVPHSGPSITALGRRVLAAVAVTSAAAGYGWLASAWARDGWPVWVALAVPGVIAGFLAWPQRVTTCSQWRSVGCWAWAGVFVLAALWQLTAFLLQQQPAPDRLYDHPTVSLFIDPLVQSQPGRAAGFAVWLAGGYVLLRRAQAANTKGADGDCAE